MGLDLGQGHIFLCGGQEEEEEEECVLGPGPLSGSSSPFVGF